MAARLDARQRAKRTGDRYMAAAALLEHHAIMHGTAEFVRMRRHVQMYRILLFARIDRLPA